VSTKVVYGGAKAKTGHKNRLEPINGRWENGHQERKWPLQWYGLKKNGGGRKNNKLEGGPWKKRQITTERGTRYEIKKMASECGKGDMKTVKGDRSSQRGQDRMQKETHRQWNKTKKELGQTKTYNLQKGRLVT